ncbi:MAG: hypothetical protein ABIQ39_10725 [Ilumatobacteraceae bacterium]
MDLAPSEPFAPSEPARADTPTPTPTRSLTSTDGDLTTTICGSRACTWCAAEFPIVYRPGRARLYCNHTCRQRAYEHRHGFRHDRTVRRLPGQTSLEPRPAHLGSGHERGGHSYNPKSKIHALRTSVRPERGRRETLCGTLSSPMPGKPFLATHPNVCRVCAQIANDNPLEFPIQPSNELPRLRAMIDEAAEHRNDPTAALRWLQLDNREPQRSDRAA